jgi:hypothetical protein
MGKDSNASGGGIGLSGAVFIVFLVLKLTHQVAWSWWWVTSPLWGSVALVLAIFVAALIVAAVAEVAKDHRQ